MLVGLDWTPSLVVCFQELARDYELVAQQWNQQKVVSSGLGAWRPDYWPKKLMVDMVKEAMTKRDQRLMRHAFAGWLGKDKVWKFSRPAESVVDSCRTGAKYSSTVFSNGGVE